MPKIHRIKRRKNKPGREAEVIREPHHRQFQHDEPESARQQEAREPARPRIALTEEKYSHAGREHKYRQTEMRHPARGKKDRCGPAQVGGRERRRPGMKEIPHVIERHDNHDGATKRIHRRPARRRTRAGLCGGIHRSCLLSRTLRRKRRRGHFYSNSSGFAQPRAISVSRTPPISISFSAAGMPPSRFPARASPHSDIGKTVPICTVRAGAKDYSQ